MVEFGLARTRGAVVNGIDGQLVEVEAHIGSGLPAMTIVGLPDTAVSESRDRARAAVANSGAKWPKHRITVGLSPASVHKRGPSLDLAVAISVLAATEQVPRDIASSTVMIGELALDGRLRPVRGVVAMALAVRAAGLERIVVPVDNVAEAALVTGLRVIGVSSLRHLGDVLRGDDVGVDVPGWSAAAHPTAAREDRDRGSSEAAVGALAPDLSQVIGQTEARTALEVAAAGGHHLAMVGPPGVGKTLLAERLPGLLPPLSQEESLEVTALQSVAGVLPKAGLVSRPPFQAPHHTASHVAIIGGGHSGQPRLGLASLAHRGVLFLDEAPEFGLASLEALRQPLESGRITVSRAGFSVVFPARFLLVLAANPCPCGRLGSPGPACLCTPQQIRRYAGRLSGPLLDRIDLQLWLSRPTLVEVRDTTAPESSAVVAERVAEARARALHRWRDTPWRTNAEAPATAVRDHWPATRPGELLLQSALAKYVVSLRAVDRLRRVAWTLADLAGVCQPGEDEMGRAMGLQSQQQGWAA